MTGLKNATWMSVSTRVLFDVLQLTEQDHPDHYSSQSFRRCELDYSKIMNNRRNTIRETSDLDAFHRA